MSDPIHHKLDTQLFLEATYKDAEKPICFHVLANKAFIESLPKDVIENRLKQELDRISITPVSAINKTHLVFSYDEPDTMKAFDFGNVLIQAHLPYCLHIPNHYEIKVSLPEHQLEALVIFEKIWTNKAESNGKRSDQIDLFAEDRPIYFRHSTMLMPSIPVDTALGWDLACIGTNIEKIDDRNGVFRFTKLLIQFNSTERGGAELSRDEAVHGLLEDLKNKSLLIVNRIIDVYREKTNEIHVRRLGDVNTPLLYFTDLNQGYYLLNPNLETAMVNRSRMEIESISHALSSGEKPELYKVLLLDARSLFKTKEFTLAIVESFQSLETFLENYLLNELQLKERSYEQSMEYLKKGKNWMTKTRLNDILKELKGSALNIQTNIWNKWCIIYDKTRNEVIHAGREPSEKETKDTLDVNEEVIRWILSL